MQDSNKFPSLKIPRFIEPVGLAEIQVGVTALDVDMHITTNNFAPNEYRVVFNPSGLAVSKGSNAREKGNSNCN